MPQEDNPTSSGSMPLPINLKGKVSAANARRAKDIASWMTPGKGAGALGKFGRLSTLGKVGAVGGAAGLALGAVDLLLNPTVEFGAGILDQVNPSRVDRRLERMVSGQEQVEQFQRMRAKRDRKLQELTQRNTLLLAQNAPHLFNQLMAGRTLPRGATVIGGEPRTDLVEEVAMGMTQGRFPPPTEGDLNLGGV